MSNNTKDKQLVCCKSCNGVGHKRKHIKIDIPCKRCSGIGSVPWLNNLVKKEVTGIQFSKTQNDDSYYHILVMIHNLEELCETVGIKPNIKLIKEEYRGDVTDRIKERVANSRHGWTYTQLKKEI